MLKKNKKILIIFSVGIVLIVSMFFVFNKKEEYKELPRVKLKDSINHNGLAIMVEDAYQSDKYKTYEGNTFPTDGYTLNLEKSGCVDRNGKTVDALVFNENNTVSIKTKQSVYCYLYYNRNIFLGNGTEDSPYQIIVIEDLVRLSNIVNNGETYSGKYFELTRDLDFQEKDSYENSERTDFGNINGVSETETLINELTNQDGTGFIPIGSNEAISFQGIFDGKNYTLSNIYIKNNTASASIGLFGTIKNATISNLKINGTMNTSVDVYMGSIVGSAYGKSTFQNIESSTNLTGIQGAGRIGGIIGTLNDNSDTNLTKLINRGTITEGNYNSGIIGWAAGTNVILEDCHNYGNVTQSGGSTSSKSGGIVGTTRATIKLLKLTNCSNEASITGNYWTGGLVGAVNNPNGTITNSFNSGEINGEMNTGGIVGYTNSTLSIEECVNYGEIKVNSTLNSAIVGGLIGTSYKELEITNSHNEGIINVNGIKYLRVGGLVGNSENITNISNSYNIGEINSSTSGNEVGHSVGGILGEIHCNDTSKISKIENCYNKGNINGGVRTGGIIGFVGGVIKLVINKCHNSGNITGQEDAIYKNNVEVGGILGQGWDGPTVYILNSYNTGELIANSKNYGGMAGGIAYGFENSNNASNGYIINSYNKGKITAKTPSSGISRISHTSFLTLNNVYNIGEVNSPNKTEIVYVNPNGTIKSIDNAYYKEGLVASNKSLTGLYPLTDANMKNPDGNDSNSLLYKLNQNVTNLNNAGLSSIDESIGTDLDGYTLVNWVIDPTTGYPTLDYNNIFN